MKFIARRAFPMSQSWSSSFNRVGPWHGPTIGESGYMLSYAACSRSGSRFRYGEHGSRSFSRDWYRSTSGIR